MSFFSSKEHQQPENIPKIQEPDLQCLAKREEDVVNSAQIRIGKLFPEVEELNSFLLKKRDCLLIELENNILRPAALNYLFSDFLS